MICYYCQKNEATNFNYVNPHTKETHPTCPVCEYSFELLIKDQKKFKLIKTIGNLLLFFSLIGFFTYGWKVGALCIILGIVLKLAFYVILGAERILEKRERLEGQFAEEHSLFSFHSTKCINEEATEEEKLINEKLKEIDDPWEKLKAYNKLKKKL